MARRLRIHVPEGWYHVMSRGNGGEAVYRSEEDRRRFLGLVAELPQRFGTEVHAFVLMDNHYHLLVRCRGLDLSDTEGPIRQGRLESPWEGLVAGVVLGNGSEAAALLGGAERNPEGQAQMMRQAAARVRPEWGAIVRGAELILGREWAEMAEGYGDWGRDGTMAVATRHLGWRLVEVARQVRGLKYAAAAQGVRRFWRRAAEDAHRAAFTRQLKAKCQ